MSRMEDVEMLESFLLRITRKLEAAQDEHLRSVNRVEELKKLSGAIIRSIELIKGNDQ